MFKIMFLDQKIGFYKYPNFIFLNQNEFRQVAPGIIKMEQCGGTLLGSPLTLLATEVVLEEKTAKLKSGTALLKKLSAYSAFFLLRMFVSLPRLIYFLRCAPAFRLRSHLIDYDASLKKALEETLNCAFTPESWAQSSLTVKMGGLGIRHALDTAIPCFLASVYSVLPLVTRLLPLNVDLMDSHVEDAMDQWSNLAMPMPRRQEDSQYRQDIWVKPIFNLTAAHLTSCTNQEDKARLMAVTQPYMGTWLTALPSPQLGTHVPNDSFRISCALRLGCDICQAHKCPCGAQVTSKGRHGLKCKQSAGRHSRHSSKRYNRACTSIS
jgi:hypothetical protein